MGVSKSISLGCAMHVVRRGAILAKNMGPLAIGVACIWLLFDQTRGMDLAAVWSMVQQVSIGQWIAALAATALSFWALGQYDALMHAHCRTGVAARDASRSGICAIAIGQSTGMAAVVSAMVRWKLLRPLDMLSVAAVTASVGIIFLMGWAFCVGIFALLPASPLDGRLAIIAIAALILVCVISVWRPTVTAKGRPLPIPSVPHIIRMTLLAFVDLVAAGAALHILLPEHLDIGLETLLPVFLIAFGAGLYSGTPGGVGAFEMSLLALLPHVPQPELLAAIVAFRLVYFAVPAAVAIIYLIYEQINEASETLQKRADGHVQLSTARHAEAQLVRQNGGDILSISGTKWLCVDTGQANVMLLDPVKGCAASALPQIIHNSRTAGRLPLLYKINRSNAMAAREQGWSVMRVSDEAVVVPHYFDLAARSLRQLRRKLRKAESAGVTTRKLHPVHDLNGMTAVAQDWRHVHRHERGISMGRFDSETISDQTCFGAFHSGRLIAFVSFHEVEREMCLDLLRNSEDIPDGTMYALINNAIDYARSHNIPRVSLAAAPAQARSARSRLHRFILQKAEASSGGVGLRRFKDCFAPRWEPRYVAAPGPMGLALALLDLTRGIHWPDRINRS